MGDIEEAVRRSDRMSWYVQFLRWYLQAHSVADNWLQMQNILDATRGSSYTRTWTRCVRDVHDPREAIGYEWDNYHSILGYMIDALMATLCSALVEGTRDLWVLVYHVWGLAAWIFTWKIILQKIQSSVIVIMLQRVPQSAWNIWVRILRALLFFCKYFDSEFSLQTLPRFIISQNALTDYKSTHVVDIEHFSKT